MLWYIKFLDLLLFLQLFDGKLKKILLNQLSIERNGIVNQRQNIRRGESN